MLFLLNSDVKDLEFNGSESLILTLSANISRLLFCWSIARNSERLRKAYAEEDWETFKKLLPSEAFYDDVVQVLSGGAGGPVNENFLLAAPQSFLVERQLTAAEYKKKGEIANV